MSGCIHVSRFCVVLSHTPSMQVSFCPITSKPKHPTPSKPWRRSIVNQLLPTMAHCVRGLTRQTSRVAFESPTDVCRRTPNGSSSPVDDSRQQAREKTSSSATSKLNTPPNHTSGHAPSTTNASASGHSVVTAGTLCNEPTSSPNATPSCVPLPQKITEHLAPTSI